MEVGELPPELISAPQQLVCVAGLDASHNSVHKTIWDSFTLNRRHDRLPFVFEAISRDEEFPKGKPKRTTYESYVPRGVLKTNWMNKHLKEIPSVVVLFMDLDWSHSSWAEKKTECQSKVESLRHGLEGRNTRLAVVLIQSAAPWPPGEDVLAAERATELCTACDLSPKSLFVLPKTDHLFGYILRLEHAFHELAQAYYQAEIRRVKSKKEYLNKATHQSLLVRCQFKLGFFSELRQDSHTALRHYKLAFQHLTELSLPENHWLEWKTIAGFLNYKICRLCFSLSTPLDAISQFRRHVDFFRSKTGGPLGLAESEHCAWLSGQFSLFGELFETAVQNGLAAIQTQHPGFYFHSAAQHAMARKGAVKALWSSVSGVNYPSPDPLENTRRQEFYGQRPWRIGLPEGQLFADESAEEVGYLALKMREVQKDLSGAVLQLLNSAMSQFKRYRSPRTRRFIMVQMGEEYLGLGDYGKALQIFSQAIWEYRQERWWLLLKGILLQALQCAFCLGNVKEYVCLCFELAGSVLVSADEKSRIQTNLMRLLNGNLPEAEPGLPQHSVQNALAIWRREVTDRCFFLIEMQPLNACVEARAWFAEDKVFADSLVKVKVAVRLSSPFPIQFGKLSVTLNPSTPEYDLRCIVEDSNADASSGQLYFVPGKVQVYEFDFVPRAVDVGNEISINSVSLDVGQLHSPIYGTLHWEGAGSLSGCTVSPEYTTSCRNVGIFERKIFKSTTKIIPRKALVCVEVIHDPPLLVNESYLFSIKVTNKEKFPITSARLTVSAENSDFNPFVFSDGQTSEKPLPLLRLSMDILNPDESLGMNIFAVAVDVGEWDIRFEVDYNMCSYIQGRTTECHCVKKEIISVTVIQPFTLHCRLLSVGKNDGVERFVQHEPCLIAAELKAASPFELRLDNIEWNLASFLRLEDKSTREFSNVSLKKDETCSFFAYVLPVSLCDGTVPAGSLEISWKRSSFSSEEDTTIRTSVNWISLPCFGVEFSPLVVRASLPAYGSVRQALVACLTLVNHSDSVLEVQAALESAEAFMFSGHKQVQLRLLPLSERKVRYVFFPLAAGNVSLPILRLSSPSYPQETLDRLAQRTLPTHLFVLPYGRELGIRTDTVDIRNRHLIGKFSS